MELSRSQDWKLRSGAVNSLARLKGLDAEAEAAETQTWVSFAAACGYLLAAEAEALKRECDFVIGKLVVMISRPEDWIISSTKG